MLFKAFFIWFVASAHTNDLCVQLLEPGPYFGSLNVAEFQNGLYGSSYFVRELRDAFVNVDDPKMIRKILSNVPFYHRRQNGDIARPGEGHRHILESLGKVTLYRAVVDQWEAEKYSYWKDLPDEEAMAHMMTVSPKYGAIFTTPNDKFSGLVDQPVYVLSFVVDFTAMPEAVRDEIYAGIENSVLEVAFISARARLWLLRSYSGEYKTIPPAPRPPGMPSSTIIRFFSAASSIPQN